LIFLYKLLKIEFKNGKAKSTSNPNQTYSAMKRDSSIFNSIMSTIMNQNSYVGTYSSLNDSCESNTPSIDNNNYYYSNLTNNQVIAINELFYYSSQRKKKLNKKFYENESIELKDINYNHSKLIDSSSLNNHDLDNINKLDDGTESDLKKSKIRFKFSFKNNKKTADLNLNSKPNSIHRQTLKRKPSRLTPYVNNNQNRNTKGVIILRFKLDDFVVLCFFFILMNLECF
jgi:hypothetical protein